MKPTKKKSTSVISDVVIINPLDDAKESIGATLRLLTSALTLVSALAWNDAIKYVFDELNVQFQGIATMGKFGYAIIITFITVFIITRLEKLRVWIEKNKSNKKKK